MTKNSKHSLAFRASAGAAAALVAALALANWIHPWGELRSGDRRLAQPDAILMGSSASQPVRSVLARACLDCHSNNTRWPLYSRIAPASWLVEHDVKQGREHLNLSRWEQYSIDNRIDLLARIGSQLRRRKMPPKQYQLLHPEARLSEAAQSLLLDWAKSERKQLLAGQANPAEGSSATAADGGGHGGDNAHRE